MEAVLESPRGLRAGLIAVRVAAVRALAPSINAYELEPLDAGQLPAWDAGAHIDLHLEGGLVRQYSLVNEGERGRYVVAVKLDPAGRGGSASVHRDLRPGTGLSISAPRNNFRLREAAPHSVLIAGGIGITPIVAMARRLRALGRLCDIHYGVRTARDACFAGDLGPALQLHVDELQGGRPMDVATIVSGAPSGSHLYCCGPGPMLDAFEAAGARRADLTLHLERFAAAPPATRAGGSYCVRLARSGMELPVPQGVRLLDVLRKAGIDVDTSCEQGICGTCQTTVLEGVPEHRDHVLSVAEKASNTTMMVCCSGSRGERLVLDL